MCVHESEVLEPHASDLEVKFVQHNENAIYCLERFVSCKDAEVTLTPSFGCISNPAFASKTKQSVKKSAFCSTLYRHGMRRYKSTELA